MRPQAIFFDIDGTLVSFETHSIPASAKKAINMLKDKGIKVFISTGRALCDVNNLEDLLFDGLITANGAYCIDSNGTVIHKSLLPKESLQLLANYLEDKPFPCEFMTDRGTFINYEDEVALSVGQLVNLPVPPVKPVLEVLEYDVFQLGIFVDTELETYLMTNIFPDCINSRWHPAFADITAKNCCKAAGMKKVLEYFGIEKEHTMAFGDGGNDISMLKYAQTGIAMGNANDEVKAAANYVTDSIDNDGIMNALKYFKII